MTDPRVELVEAVAALVSAYRRGVSDLGPYIRKLVHVWEKHPREGDPQPINPNERNH
jgi:hypothetical protein